MEKAKDHSPCIPVSNRMKKDFAISRHSKKGFVIMSQVLNRRYSPYIYTKAFKTLPELEK